MPLAGRDGFAPLSFPTPLSRHRSRQVTGSIKGIKLKKYTVLENGNARVSVPQGFSLLAFLFPPFWAMWKKLVMPCVASFVVLIGCFCALTYWIGTINSTCNQLVRDVASTKIEKENSAIAAYAAAKSYIAANPTAEVATTGGSFLSQYRAANPNDKQDDQTILANAASSGNKDAEAQFDKLDPLTNNSVEELLRGLPPPSAPAQGAIVQFVNAVNAYRTTHTKSNQYAVLTVAEAADAQAKLDAAMQSNAAHTRAIELCKQYPDQADRWLLQLRIIVFVVGIIVSSIFGIRGNKWVETYFMKNGFTVVGTTWANNKKEALLNIKQKTQPLVNL